MGTRKSSPAGGDREARGISFDADERDPHNTVRAEKPQAPRPRGRLTRADHEEVAPLICALTNGIKNGIDWGSLLKGAPAIHQRNRIVRLLNLVRYDLDNVYAGVGGRSWPYTPPDAPPPDPGRQMSTCQYVAWLIETFYAPFLERISGRVPVKIRNMTLKLERHLRLLSESDFVSHRRKRDRRARSWARRGGVVS